MPDQVKFEFAQHVRLVMYYTIRSGKVKLIDSQMRF